MKKRDLIEYSLEVFIPLVLDRCGVPPLLNQISTATAKLAGMAVLDCLEKYRGKTKSLSVKSVQNERIETIVGCARDYVKLSIQKGQWDTSSSSKLESYADALYDSQSFLIFTALTETDRRKDLIFGNYWGYIICNHNESFDDQYFTVSLIKKLSYRQIVLIKLIAEGLPESIKTKTITKPEISVDFNLLYQYGFWDIMGKDINANYENFRSLDGINKTKLSDITYKRLSLSTVINKNEVNNMISTMLLKEDIPASPRLWISEEGEYAEPPE